MYRATRPPYEISPDVSPAERLGQGIRYKIPNREFFAPRLDTTRLGILPRRRPLGRFLMGVLHFKMPFDVLVIGEGIPLYVSNH